MMTSVLATPSWARSGRVLRLALLVTLSCAAIAPGDAPARARTKTKTTVVSVPGPSQGNVSIGFVALRSTRGDRAAPPKLKIANARSLPSNVTIYTGIGRARKTVGTYLAPYIIVSRNRTSPRGAVRPAQAGGPFAAGLAFVQFHRALKGKVFNANNILQSNAAVQQTFLNLCQIRKGDVNFKGAIAYLKGTPVLGFTPQGGFNPVSFKGDVKKGDCKAAYGKLKQAPGCHPKAATGLFTGVVAAQVCAAPPGGGTGTEISTTVGPPTISSPPTTQISTTVGPPTISGGP